MGRSPNESWYLGKVDLELFQNSPLRVISYRKLFNSSREMTVPYMEPSMSSTQSPCLAPDPVCIVVSVYICLLFLLLAAQSLYPTYTFHLQVWVWYLAARSWGKVIDGQRVYSELYEPPSLLKPSYMGFSCVFIPFFFKFVLCNLVFVWSDDVKLGEL